MSDLPDEDCLRPLELFHAERESFGAIRMGDLVSKYEVLANKRERKISLVCVKIFSQKNYEPFGSLGVAVLDFCGQLLWWMI